MPPAPDTRTRLLDTAARLFHEQGFTATGVSTLLREAGVNSGSLYHHFSSKEALLLAVLERYLELLRPELTDPVEEATADPVERVFALMAGYREMLRVTSCRMGCPIGNLALELADDHPEVRRLVDANFANWLDVVAGWLEDAGERLPRGTDRRALARFVLTAMEGGIMQARAAASPEPFEESIAQLRRHFELLEAEARRERAAAAV